MAFADQSVTPAVGSSIALWRTMSQRATEITDVQRRSWSHHQGTKTEGKPDTISNITLPGISPMAKTLTQSKMIKSTGNIGLSELSTFYQAQPKKGKWTPSQWADSQQYIQKYAGERMANAMSQRKQSSSNRKFGSEWLDVSGTTVAEAFQKRVSDLETFLGREETALSAINTEITGLQASLEQCLKFTNSRFSWPTQVNKCCQQFRASRLGLELVEDAVDESLKEEAEMLSSVKSESFDVLVSEADESLATMKAKAKALAMDIARKRNALTVDKKMAGLSLKDKTLGLHLPAVIREPNDNIQTQEWTDYAERLIREAEEAYSDASDLRERMKNSEVLSDELVTQHCDDADLSIQVHIREVTEAKDLTNGLLQEAKNNISSTEVEIAELKDRMDAQVKPLERNTTRLKGRHNRHDLERTRDVVHDSLVMEVAEMDGVMTAMKEEHDMAVECLEELRNVEAMLEEDYAMKTKSLQIDEKCLKLRSYLASDVDPQKIKMMQRGGAWVEWGLRW